MGKRIRLVLGVALVLAGGTGAVEPPTPPAARTDGCGDPLPPGAVHRLGTVRFRKAGSVMSVAYAPDGKTLASASRAPGGRTLASGASRDNTVRLWDMATGKELRQCQGHQSWVTSVAYAPDGKTLASASWDTTVRLWDVATGKELRQLQGRQGGVNSVAYAPDGKTLASGGDDGTQRLWEICTGRERLVLSGQAVPVAGAAWSPDGRLLASDSSNGTFVLWDVFPGAKAGKKEASAKALQHVWADLASDDAAHAFQAIRLLAAHPAQAVPFLQERLKPAVPVDPKRVARLTAHLESNDFPTRQKATEDLERLGDLAVSALEKALASKPALETRTRIERLLEKTTQVPPPDVLRSLRALEALEHAGTPAALQLLETVAQGADGAMLTRESQAALQRLTKLAGKPKE